MMKQLLFILLLVPTLAFGQCAGIQSATLSPLPTNGNYEPGTVVTMCYTMNGWDTGFGSNWIEGFGITLGSGWVSYSPISGPDDCGGNVPQQQWLWLESVTNNSGTLTVGPGYFYEGPTGPIDGNPGNDWGDFGTNCLWTLCIQLQVSDQCDPLSLLIEVTPYADGTMGSWGNEACFDGPYQVFNGTIAGGNVNTSAISVTTDTTCFNQSLGYSVINTPGSIYNWQLSGGGVLSSNANTAQVLWSNVPGNYTVSVQETTIDGCVGDIIDTVITVVDPILTLDPPVAICPNTEHILFASPGGGIWSGLNMTSNHFNSPNPGSYYEAYTVNIYGCVITDSALVVVSQPLTDTTILCSSTILDFCEWNRYQSYYMPDLPGVSYVWHVDGELVNTISPEFYTDFELTMLWPDSTMVHYIEVYGVDSAGCQGETSYLTVQTFACHRLFVPNSFTPNGDGFNDAFKVSGLSVYHLDLKIYNRYGQIVCNLKSLNQTWNGDDGTGYFAQAGVYNWHATYEDDKGFGHTAKGHIILIR